MTLLALTNTPAWFAKAACRGSDTAMFFPQREDGRDTAGLAKKAKAVCKECPVREECLMMALAANEPGIWGGTTVKERARIRRRRRLGLERAAA